MNNKKRNEGCIVGKSKTQFEKMELKMLSENFYQQNGHLSEVMDKSTDGVTYTSKAESRGYGVLLFDVEGLKFAIPFRSNIPHKKCFVSKKKTDTNGRIRRMGLDYTKSVVITDESFVTNQSFKMKDSREYFNVVNNEDRIIFEFSEYVKKYKKAIQENDENIIAEYKLSTLKNYHQNLGLS
jgi:protein AbiQ